MVFANNSSAKKSNHNFKNKFIVGTGDDGGDVGDGCGKFLIINDRILSHHDMVVVQNSEPFSLLTFLYYIFFFSFR